MIAIENPYTSPFTAGDVNPPYLVKDFFSDAWDLIKRDKTRPYDDNATYTLDNNVSDILLVIPHTETQAASEHIGIPLQVIQDIANALSIGQQVTFEDGVDNEFHAQLERIIKQYGTTTLDYLRKQIMLPNFNTELASETMRYLGDLHHIPSYGRRLQLLMGTLTHPSAKVRDGAALGIAALDDPQAIPALQNAIKYESIIELREDMELVLEQLEETV